MAILTHEDGVVTRTPEDAQHAEAAGYVNCATHKAGQGPFIGQSCGFYISPEAQSSLQQSGGYYTCPSCHHSHDFLHEMPWHGVDEDEATENQRNDAQGMGYHPGFSAGGGTRIGLPMEVQAEIGEQLVANIGDLPGYGPLTWWHEGGSLANSPLDGATEEWGIEVKTLGYDAMHHRFIPGRVKEKQHKNEMAAQMGKKGVLGVLVLLDYRRSVADIYVQEFPLEAGGVKTFRSSSKQAQHLVKEVPFRNPLMDPHDPTPKVDNPEMPF